MYFCNTDSLYFSRHSRGDASSNSKICGSIVFTITGYFLLDSYGKVTRARILRKMGRIVKITILADVFYMIFRYGCFAYWVGGQYKKSSLRICQLKSS